VVACRRIVSDIAEVMGWIWSGVVWTTRTVVRITHWATGVAISAGAKVVAGVAVAVSATHRSLTRAAMFVLQTVLGAVHLAIGAVRWIGTTVTAAVAWLFAGIVFATRAMLHGALQVAYLPVVAWRRLKAGAKRTVGKLSEQSARAASKVASAGIALRTLPSRLVASGVSSAGTPGLKRAGALLVLGGQPGLSALRRSTRSAARSGRAIGRTHP
jgi:hypothetical protein